MSSTSSSVLLLLVAVVLFVASICVCGFYIEKTGRLEAELAQSQYKVRQLQHEKQLTEMALQNARALRESIHEQAQIQQRETEMALQNNADWSDIPVPADIIARVLKATAGAGTGAVSAPGNTP